MCVGAVASLCLAGAPPACRASLVSQPPSSCWRAAVRSTVGTDRRDPHATRTIEVLIDSETLQKSRDDVALIALAADLQQHRRLPGIRGDVSELLDKKARGIGNIAQAVMKSRMTSILLDGLRR